VQTVHSPEPAAPPSDPADLLNRALDTYWSDDFATEPLRSKLRMAAVFMFLARELGVPQ
jgi:hypothetical protein